MSIEFEAQQKKALSKLWGYYDYNKAAMARGLGVTSMAVHKWFDRGRISATKARLAERKTNGFVTKQELRPDVAEWFGE